MRTFADFSAEYLVELIENKTDISFFLPFSISGFSSTDKGDFLNEKKKIPPSSVIYSNEFVADLLLHHSEGKKGEFDVFLVLVYFFGGEIYYTLEKEGDDYLVAQVEW